MYTNIPGGEYGEPHLKNTAGAPAPIKFIFCLYPNATMYNSLCEVLNGLLKRKIGGKSVDSFGEIELLIAI